MDYNNTYKNLMNDLKGENQATNNTDYNNTKATVYDDFRLTVSNNIFTAAGLNKVQKILVYISNTQNVVYLTDKRSLGNEYNIFKILQHTPNMGIRLNVGKMLNIGEVPAQVKIQVQNGMIKIYPTNGLNRLPADKAFDAVNKSIQSFYGFGIDQFLDRLEKGVI